MKKFIKFLFILLPFSLFANQENVFFDNSLKFNDPNCNLFTYSFVNGDQQVIKYNFSPLEFYDGDIDVIIENASTGELITNFIHTNNGTTSRTINFKQCSVAFPDFCNYYINTHIIVYINYKNCSKQIDLYF